MGDNIGTLLKYWVCFKSGSLPRALPRPPSSAAAATTSPASPPPQLPVTAPVLLHLDMRNLCNRLAGLRTRMKQHNVAAYIVPTADAHQSEYVSDRDKRRAWLSGFDGSAGTAVVTDDKALLWTDSRYFVQASHQLNDEWTLMKAGQPNVPTLETWLAANMKPASRIGFDPFLTQVAQHSRYRNAFKSTMEAVGLDTNLVDSVWTDRPSLPENTIFDLEVKYSGESVSDKIARVQAAMAEKKAGALLVTALDDVAWLCNLRGSDIVYNPVFMSYAFVTPNTVMLYLDASKLTPSASASLKEHGVTVRPYEAVCEDLASFNDKTMEADAADRRKIWLDRGACSVKLHSLVDPSLRLEKAGPIALMKGVKNQTEIGGMRACHLRDAVAVCRFLHWMERQFAQGAQGLTESTVASQLEDFRSQQKDYMGLSFATISAAGPNGAIIHYEPEEKTAREVTAEEVYLFDSGGQYRDGTTDITRTVHFGTPTAFNRRSFTRVLQGHIALAAVVFPSTTVGPTLDVLARQPLWKDGLEYLHGTGHGVGSFLNVHEGPHGIGSTLRENAHTLTKLTPGMTVTNEPGYYHEAKEGDTETGFGIRIENVMLVQKADTPHQFMGKQFLRFEQLTQVPIQRKMLDLSIMTADELAWLNDYHASVRANLEGMVADEDREWLMRSTEQITK